MFINNADADEPPKAATKEQLERELAERVKELNCFYEMSKIIDASNSVEEIFSATVSYLPKAWQYPEVCDAWIVLGQKQFGKPGARVSTQRATIVAWGQPLGFVEVSYAVEKPHSDDGPFLREERRLITAVAERLGKVVEHVGANDKLREQQQVLENVLSNVPQYVFWKERNLFYLGCNNNFAKIAGLENPEDVVGKDDYDLAWRKEDSDFYRQCDREVMEKGEALLNLEEPQLQADGRKAVLLTSKVPLRNKHGEVAGILGVFSDITEQKEVEIEHSHSRKLEAVGRLASGVAHEIKTPTQYVTDNLTFLGDSWSDLGALLDKCDELKTAAEQEGIAPGLVAAIDSLRDEIDLEFLKEEVPRAQQEALEGASRISEIVRAMKAFAHPGAEEKEPADINQAISDTVTISRSEWKYVADLETEFDNMLPAVPCFVGDFNQVILNLIVNAAHAIEDVKENFADGTGRITISTKKNGENALITVSDNGGGIPEDIQDRIFEPFFTSKERGKGSGQGLAISRSVIEKHGGELTFDTTPGKGTAFVISLPLG